MLSEQPLLFLAAPSRIKDKIKEIMKLGYTEQDALKIMKSFSVIFSYSYENMKSKIDALIKLGFTKEEALEIVKITPVIFSYSVESMHDKVNAIKSLGITHEAVVQIIKGFPALLGASLNNITAKFSYYTEIGIMDYILKHPKELMQSTELTKARYNFLTECGIDIVPENIARLFYGNKIFESCYRISKEELLNRYLANQPIKTGGLCTH